MYAEAELLYPYLQCFSQEVHPFEELYEIQKSDVSMSNLIPTCTVSDYDLGGEGDLFKAPEPIIEEQVIGLDPMTTVSMIPCGDDATCTQPLKVVDVELIQSEQLLNEAFYKCERNLMVNSGTEEPVSNIQDEKTPVVLLENPLLEKDKLFSQEPIQKSVSSGCLSSMDCIPGCVLRPNFLDFQKVHFRTADGIRRAFSEGDIQTLSNGNINLLGSTLDRPLNTEGRMEKLSRYRRKKKRRNFGRTIKYECRKALADNQRRVRGRFAKTEESDTLKK